MYDPICECGHPESLHSDKDNGCYACPCEEFIEAVGAKSKV